MRINQFHSGVAESDAITNQMLDICEILKKEGYDSVIYADRGNIPAVLKSKIHPIDSYVGDKDNILLLHHSMGFDSFERIISLPDKKCLIYHNITPEKYITDDITRKYIRIGLRQTKAYRHYIGYSIADSNYNRQRLLEMGYRNVDVMPIQSSLDRFEAVEADPTVKSNLSGIKNILFVGRVVMNKRQDDLIRAFAVYAKYYEPNSRLLIVGDTGLQDYVRQLHALSAELGIENKVLIMGKLSNAALKACYDETDVFLCASEHEGFCVPLIEAMRMGIPVIAYASSAIPETMGGSGILLSEKNPNVIGALLNEVISDRDLYEKIVTDQLERIARLKKADTPTILLRAIENIQNGVRQRTIQMQGPFESSYSLAIVNRKLMEAMDDLENDDVSIYCAEGPGDYMPKPADLKDKPHAKALWKKSHDMHYPDVVIRNMFPPRVADVRGGINLQLFGWEETRVPNMYVYGFNQYLNGIGTMSSFVSQTLKNCGLKIPVEPIGIGVDLPNGYDSIRPYSVKANAQTVFLHISSAFSRKGVDILLRAYFRAFSSDDSVCLIVKCFPNIHNKVEEQLNEINASHANPPAVELINLDIPTEELYSLYKAADCYVHVARGEGFGLTVAEAMLAHVPVIVSPNTGMADFCNKDTALLVDYKMVSAKTHLSDGSSMWAEPDENQLTEMLKQFHFSRDTLPVRETTENAYNLISTKFTWTAVAQRWSQFIDRIENEQYKPRIAMLSTWNNKCGIAEYTRMLCEHLGRRIELTVYPNHGVILESSDEDFVAPRLWHSAFIDDTDDLITVLKDSDHDIVHIQFNFGFFSLDGIERIIDELYKTKAIIISFHKTVDTVVNGKLRSFQSIRQSLNHCDALIVHQEADRDLLVEYGVHEKLISIIPLGQIVYDDPGREASRKKIGVSGSPVLGSYGFLLPNKGIKECIEAVSILRREHPNVLYLVRCALYEVHESSEYFNECKSLVESMGLERNVRFFVDFMDNEKSMEILHACDIMLSTYLPVSESASGAVRFCIAAQRPVITTRQAIFEEFEDCSEQIEQADPELIAAAVAKVRNPEVYDSYCKKMASHVDNTSWDNVCEKTHELYKKTDEARSKAYARME